MNHETRSRLLVGLQAITLASIFLMLPGCATVSPRGLPVDGPVPAVGAPVQGAGAPVPAVDALNVRDPDVKEKPDLVNDAEVSEAQAALRDASAWGAKFYEPQMYAKAKAAFDAAMAAREGDPARCRSLMAQATAAASSAREAALLAYEEDVRGRFEVSRAKLLEIRADRAFPDEFTRLVSGIDAIVGLFAARSYWDARLEAHDTLKGMSDLYERVDGLLRWLKDAQIRTESALNTARAQNASVWAPAEMKDAEQKYRDALTQMQADDLSAAVDSMKAAGLVAVRLPLLRDEMYKRGTGVPLAGGPAGGRAGGSVAPRHDKEIQGPNTGSQPPSAGSLPAGQQVRIAEMSMSSLGAPQKLYPMFSSAVARFDVVAALGLRDAGIMEKVLAGMDESWEAAVSRSGYFGFIYSDRIQLVKDLGTYAGKGEFLHAPYAAQFRLVGTRFRVNLVLCHIEPSRDPRIKAAEIAVLADVHRYFENLTGNGGITLLLAGGLGDLPGQASESLIPQGEMVPLRANLTAAEGLRDHGQRMFASAQLRMLVEKSGFGPSTPPVAYVTLGTGK